MAAADILKNQNQKSPYLRRYSVTVLTVQSWTCELGYGADTMFHRTYFLFFNVPLLFICCHYMMNNEYHYHILAISFQLLHVVKCEYTAVSTNKR